jgi:hypothetical protein
LEFFESSDVQTFDRKSCDAAQARVNHELPQASSLEPCSRPWFRKHLRPREVPPPPEELHMDCLPSVPACGSAPSGPSTQFWAEQMQCAALADEICKDTLVLDSCLDLPLDDSFIMEETVVSPVPPRSVKPKGRPRPSCQKTPQESALSTVRRSTSAPRTQVTGCIDFSSTNLQLDIGSIWGGSSASARSDKKRPVSIPPPTSTAPAPPDGPPPTGKALRPHLYAASAASDALQKLALKTSVTHPIISPRAVSGMSITQQALQHKALNLSAMCSHPVKTGQSAMAMDLGDKATIEADIDWQIPADGVAPQLLTHTAFRKSSEMLPPILTPMWGGATTPRGSWKAHDVV